MGCTFDGALKKTQHYDETHMHRRSRTFSIDTRRQSTKVVDKIIENVTIKN